MTSFRFFDKDNKFKEEEEEGTAHVSLDRAYELFWLISGMAFPTRPNELLERLQALVWLSG